MKYRIELINGPLDGGVLDEWEWYTDEKGQRGEREGILIMENSLTYKCTDETKTRAKFVKGYATPWMVEQFYD